MNKDEIITKTIEECISKNILKDYLKEHESEVRSMIDMEAEQEFATRCYGKEMYNDGVTYAIVNLVKKGLLSVNDAAKELNLSENELKKLII